MKQTKAMRTGRLALAAITTLALAGTLALGGCAQSGEKSASQGTDATELSTTGAGAVDQDRVNAKTVIRSASDLFTMVDLGLTDADSGAVISMEDAAYADFFAQLKSFRDVANLDVTDASFKVSIIAVEAATARGSQTNYRYTIDEASVTVNGTAATYNQHDGLVVG